MLLKADTLNTLVDLLLLVALLELLLELLLGA
jgi:hypothetical protein